MTARGSETDGVTTDESFEDFVAVAEPSLRRAVAGIRGPEVGRDGAAEAVAWAWEHWGEVREMRHPLAYLYRVALSRTRRRREGLLPMPVDLGLPDVEPGLVGSLQRLPTTQRTAVWLVHGCGWSYEQVAEAMEIGTSTVGTHVSRALAALRNDLGGPDAHA